MFTRNYSVKIVLILTCVVVIFIRFWGLTQAPMGYYKDESSIAYSGYSILETGKDEFGNILPLFFRSLGDYKEPIFIYSQLPFILILGPGILATKVTAAIWGLATIAIFALFIYKRWANLKLVTLAIIILGLLPWHFHFSRIGFQLITLPFFFALYMLCVDRLLATYHKKWLYLGSATLALLFYTYYLGKFLALTYIIIQYFLTKNHISQKIQLQAIGIFSAFLLPALIWGIFHPETFSARFAQVTILGNSNNLAEITSAYLAGYFSHFTPDFWFFKGDSNLRHSTQFHYPLLWTTIPLFFAGIIGVVKRRKYLFYKFILLSLVIFPAISALTTNAPHIHRTVHMTVVVAFVLVLGAIEIKSWFKSRQLYLTIFLLTIWFGFTLVELSEVGKYYFTDYAQRARSSFHYEDIEVISQLENYPLPHILSTQITEGSLTTYYLVHRTDPKLVQAYPYEVSIFDNLYPDPKPENPLKVSMENLEAPESVFINATYLMPKSLCNLHQEKIEVLYRSEHFCIATKSRLKN